MHYAFTKDSIAFEAIALESTLLANMVNSVKNYFPGFMESIKPAFDSLSNITPPTLSKLFKSKTLEDKLNEAKYENVKYLKVSVPEGFNGNYLEYLELLNETLSYFDASYQSINEYYVLVSSIVTNKEAKKSLKDETKEYKDLEKSRMALNDKISDMFKARSTEALSTFGKHFKTNKEYSGAVVAASVLDRHLRAINIETVKGKVKQIVDVLSILIEQADKGNIAYMTPEVTKNIAFGAKEVAHQVEFLSVNLYRTIGALTALDDTSERVERFI